MIPRTTSRQLGLGAIVAACLVLISLTWFGTLSAVQSQQAAAQARVETIAGAGHWLQHDKPQEVLGAIRKFLGLEASSDS